MDGSEGSGNPGNSGSVSGESSGAGELAHVHHWRHVGGIAFGMYRCDAEPDGCLAFGYSKVYRGVSRVQKIVPYSCTKCKGWAVGHDVVHSKEAWRNRASRREWRCKNHRVEKTNAGNQR